jgi:hypothetical protein
MASLWKTATPSQHVILRIVSGAVRNAAHAHSLDMPRNFARSVAKRAVGTLTAGWPDVLAAKRQRRQMGRRDAITTRCPECSYQFGGHSNGGRLGLARRPPILRLWQKFASEMWKIKRGGTPEQHAAHVRVLQLLDQAQRELDALDDAGRKDP